MAKEVVSSEFRLGREKILSLLRFHRATAKADARICTHSSLCGRPQLNRTSTLIGNHTRSEPIIYSAERPSITTDYGGQNEMYFTSNKYKIKDTKADANLVTQHKEASENLKGYLMAALRYQSEGARPGGLIFDWQARS